MPQIKPFFDDFANYICDGDTSHLAPYLSEKSNTDFLKIYRNGAIKAGVDALSANFPTLKLALGDDSFKHLCRDYILKNWPTDSRLSTYGEQLSEHIEQNKETFSLQDVDFAMLDYAWLTALLSQDDEQLTNESINAILSDGNLESLEKLTLSSSVQLVHLKRNSISDWIKTKFQINEESDQQGFQTILFWRRENAVHYRPLNNFETAFIEAMLQSGSIFSAAEAAISVESSEDVSILFSALLSSGILTTHSQRRKDHHDNTI